MRHTRFSLWSAVSVAAAIALAGYVALDAARASLVRVNPVVAASLPDATAAKIAKYGQLLGRPDKLPSEAIIMRAVRERIKDSPLDANALNLMAYAADPSGKTSKAERYAAVATRVSRRITFSQLVMSYAMLREDRIDEAMAHFDAILRARPEAAPLFFPQLQRGLRQPEMRASVAGLLSEGSPWVLSFLSDASNTPAHAGHVAQIMLLAGDRVHKTHWENYGGQFITRAFDAGEYALASKLLERVPGGSSAMFRDVSLTARNVDDKFGVAAWTLVSNATGSASAVDGGEGSPKLSIYAAGASRDALAIKNLLLSRGSWRLRQKFAQSGNTQGASAFWRMSCIGSGQIWESGNLLTDSPALLGPITIRDACPAQRLELLVNVPFGAPAIDLSVSDLQIQAIRQN